MEIRMTAQNGTRYKWSIGKRQKYTNLVAGRKPRNFFGWSFIDHEGYERIVEGNWKTLISEFHETASRYGLECVLS